MTSQKKIAVLVVAGGKGVRAGGPEDTLPKQYRPLAGKPVLKWALQAFLAHKAITHVLPVIGAGDDRLFAALNLADTRLLAPVHGGATRQLSVLAGLDALEPHAPDLVLIHDGARPFPTRQVIDGVIAGLAEAECALPATQVIDTIKRSSDGRTVGGTEDRTQLFAAQTPQGFDYARILDAHRRAVEISDSFTDDTAIAEWDGMPVLLTPGSSENIKITLPGDIERAERWLQMEKRMETRVGSGTDVHGFVPGDKVTLGGIDIPHSAGLKGHSDADAALHVLTDALLGALAEGDIGTHFPPSDDRWKGEPSATFLGFAAGRVAERGGRIVHLDLTIMCELPKIGPHVAAMRRSIADICGIAVSRVSVKATTSEKMGFVGRSEGLMTMGTATVQVPEDSE